MPVTEADTAGSRLGPGQRYSGPPGSWPLLLRWFVPFLATANSRGISNSRDPGGSEASADSVDPADSTGNARPVTALASADPSSRDPDSPEPTSPGCMDPGRAVPA